MRVWNPAIMLADTRAPTILVGELQFNIWEAPASGNVSRNAQIWPVKAGKPQRIGIL
jgi:hypothetical protein